MSGTLAPELEPFGYAEVNASGLWEPAPVGEGIHSCRLPVWNDDDELLDVVCWQFGEPARWWLRWGNVSILGESEVERAARAGNPCRMVPTPRDWLRDCGQAVCVVDWSKPLMPLLENIELVCSTQALEKRLREKLATEAQRLIRIARAA